RESVDVPSVVAKIFWLGDAMETLFDEVLLRNGMTKLVSRGRELKSEGGSHGKKLGKLLTKPLDRFSKENIIRWLVSLPLNAIPVSGPSYHARYFQLKESTTKYDAAHQDGSSQNKVSTFNKQTFIAQRKGSYAAFGAVAMALDVLVPGGAILCMLGNQVGAALWAVELERQ
ncbi:11971_t:CDS:2, partial [Acaulospora colombiana]